MRKAFVEAITPILQKDESTVFITGDLGFNAFEELRDTLGKRFINAGVAEQNMIGVAAGLACQGMRPWVYSIVPFITLRCLEQIRNDICFHNLPVHLVGNGGGYTYGMMGPTHWGLDDLGIMKCLPKMQLHFPDTYSQVSSHVQSIHIDAKPSYLRLGISGYPSEWIEACSGYPSDCFAHKVTIIAIGQAVQIALSAKILYPKEMKNITIIGITRFPFSYPAIQLIKEHIDRTDGKVIILDEHYIEGSLASDICSAFEMKEVKILCPGRHSLVGTPKFLLDMSPLNPKTLVEVVSEYI